MFMRQGNLDKKYSMKWLIVFENLAKLLKDTFQQKNNILDFNTTATTI